MKQYKFSLFLFITIITWTANAQTYIGNVLYRNTYEYAKVVCSEDTCTFSIPYLDGDKKFSLPLDISKPQNWEIKRGAELWRFNTKIENGRLVGELYMPTARQQIKFYEQNPPLSSSQLIPYEGVFEDEEKRRVIIYSRYDYLHFMSPYSEETMSLKPIGQNIFWSVSGEHATFSALKGETFEDLQITCQNGNQHHLRRVPTFTVEDLWIPIGEDTLFAQLYLPETKEKVPACLVLPGGGAVGMDNYTYEARLFASHGMASLVFDKSGNGKSKGNGHFHRQSFEEKNDQYKLLFHYLRNHPAVNPDQVGVHGPSEGGRLGLMMAIDLGHEMAFAIAASGPFMTFREGQLYAMDHHHRNMGVNEIDNMKIREIWNDYYAGILEGKIDPKVIERANIYREQNARLFLPPDFTDLPASPQRDDILNDRVVFEAGKIVCPILLQYGENDQRVHRQKSLQNIFPHLTNPASIETIIYPRGNHSFMTPEYKICPGYTSDKISWLKSIGMLK